MRFLFVMDPPTGILVDEDTSFALMLEAQRRGHRVDHCLPPDVSLDRSALKVRIRRAMMQRDPLAPITLGPSETAEAAEFDAILIRKDPPFDDHYLWCTQLLEHARDHTLVLNDPRGLRDANEKLYTCFFPELMPETLVTNDKRDIRRFVDEVGGRAVIKPLGNAGGDGVMALVTGDLNVNAIIEAATHHGRRVAMVQRLLPEVRHGDKRVLVLDGEPLGGILRVPKPDDIRSNIHVGGDVYRTEIDDDDRRIVSRLSESLRRDGLWFVGLDIIGGKLTEVNVTSPTGIQQMCRLSGEAFDARVIDSLEAKVKARSRA